MAIADVEFTIKSWQLITHTATSPTLPPAPASNGRARAERHLGAAAAVHQRSCHRVREPRELTLSMIGRPTSSMVTWITP
jgi:hypothetical protein